MGLEAGLGVRGRGGVRGRAPLYSSVAISPRRGTALRTWRGLGVGAGLGLGLGSGLGLGLEERGAFRRAKQPQ